MSAVERAFCRSAAWGSFARHVVLPWALERRPLSGDVLELGGGAGAMADGVARRFPDLRLTVTDLDPAMVDAARRRLTLRGVTVQQADVTAMTFEDASFDYVTSYLMLHHVIEWKTALAETRRVLRPGGQLLGYDLTDTPTARWIHRLDRSPHRLLRRDDLADGLAAVGFEEITVSPTLGGQVMRFRATKAIDA
ncbi:class I SAM-dependent methyltransferase [Nocardioides sp. Root190]|uniref:class I SAM-dependent methyltransferase n=1 Tax=Nocardioides sp. Root190 TaxID=1736488 RepID=UPI001F193208|nr:class I SAM-dependent methyltransferase [Nocardioides sp. Root190]